MLRVGYRMARKGPSCIHDENGFEIRAIPTLHLSHINEPDGKNTESKRLD
jgi:hypothetical protein